MMNVRARCLLSACQLKVVALFAGLFGMLMITVVSSPATAAEAEACSSILYSIDTNGDRTFRVTWTSPDEGDEYVIRRQVADSGTWHWRGRSTGTSWVDTTPDASNGQSIRYRVNPRGSNDYVYCSTTTDTTRPTVPYKPVLAEVSDTAVTLTLKHKDDNVAVNGFELYRNTANNFSDATKTDLVEPNADSEVAFTDTAVESGTSYYYWLKAVDAAGNTSYRSGALKVETSQTALPAPTTPGPPTVPGDCDSTNATGSWRTAELCGVWKIVDPEGKATVWNAVNLRGHSLVSHPLDDVDVKRLTDRFDTVRFTLKWDQLQPTDGPLSPNDQHVSAAKKFLDDAQQNNIDVILDFAHLGGGDKFGIPDWAWDQAKIGQNPKPNLSYPVWAGTDNKAGPLKGYIDELEAAGILTHPAVIAAEAVNEPHPPQGKGATTSEGQQALADVYREVTDHIRTYDPEMLVVLGAYYGGTRHGGVQTNDSFAYNHAKSELTEKGIENVVWTAHNYYTGVGDQDGVNDGQRVDGARGIGAWAEGYKSSGCYSDSTFNNTGTAWSCPTVPANRSTAQQGHKANAKGHFDYAQEASMPFFMGEWGIPRQRFQSNEYRGWGGTKEFFCDKIEAYSDVDGEGNAISWAIWSFDADADAFGIYNSRNNQPINDSAKKYLLPNTWLDNGTFPDDSSQGSWQGQPWEYLGGTPNATC